MLFIYLARVGSIGASLGIGQHLYYTWLENRLPSRTPRFVAIKVILDELLVAPILYSFNYFVALPPAVFFNNLDVVKFYLHMQVP
ncbi:unnamed protein product [Protopolystoma xenopodis]|uniref:Uncharacterized protein n=1 Tax=Protopolystoma xenopodis TaxID=117903 RepID=A0A448WN61_9PLAT|nr:unnamed protein product [Protopolystoma xenopodis]